MVASVAFDLVRVRVYGEDLVSPLFASSVDIDRCLLE
jgi:hypothetical protein